MTTLSIQHADIQAQRQFGRMVPAYSFKVAPGTLEKSSIPLLWRWFRSETDGQCEVDALLIEDIPVEIRRHVPRSSNLYTLLVDESRARTAGCHPMQPAYALMHILGVADEQVVWLNDKLSREK